MTEETSSEPSSENHLNVKETDSEKTQNDSESQKDKPTEVVEDAEEATESSKKKGKKRKRELEPHEVPEKRERSSRGAKTKAALQISMTSMKDNLYNFDQPDQQEANAIFENGLKRKGGRGAPKKSKTPEEILSSSPLKFKAGPKCTKKPLKPGPRSKRGRNFQFEELFLDQISLDEEPLTGTYNKKLQKLDPEKNPKEKLKAVVVVRDLKKARNPSVKAALDLAQDYYSTVGQFKGINNLVTVTYQKPKVTNTFQHRPDPNRVIMSERKLAPKPPPPQPPIDLNKPPPITNYMSVKIETLMNCLEKMYHHHLPLNAFTSRFPNARAKAMLTLMLDGHRKDCENCSKILDDENLGVFHSDEQKLSMDLAAYGAAIPTTAPVVDLSEYPDDVAEMKKLLVEKDAKIKALEKRLEALNKDIKPDEIDKLDLVDMLDGVNEPTMDKYSGKFLKTAGYRLVDLRLLRMALEICQNCHHNKMTLAEMSPEIEGNQEDVVTRLAFVCTICGPKAIFPTSPFSKTYPSNYSLNKLLLPLIGPSSYFHLAQFLQHNPDQPQEVITSGAFSHQKPQLLVSVDHAFFDFARPFDPPLPTDPDANLMLTGSSQVTTTSNPDLSSSEQIKLKPFSEIKAPASINLPPLKPIDHGGSTSSSPEVVPVSKPKSSKSNGSSSNGAVKDNSVVTRKIKACPELPPGCRITSVAPGTKLVSKHVKYSSTQKTGLAVGCYRVKEPEKSQERILIIRDEDKEEDPVVVTELEREQRQIDVNRGDGTSKVMMSTSANVAKKRPQIRDPDDEDDDIYSTDDDSDDPSWGSSRRKKKNDGKGKKRKRNKY